MRTKSKFLGLPLGALILVALGFSGCEQPKAAVSKDPAGSVSTFSTDATKNKVGAAATNAESTPEKSEKPAVDLAKLPPEFKNDAFEYYGFGRTDQIKLVVIRGQERIEGSQTNKFIGVENGRALFEITGEGALVGATGTYAVDKDGIKVVKSEKGKVFENEIEFPSDLKPGKTWMNNNEMTEGGVTTKLKNVIKVVGLETVKSGTKTYKDALLVTSTSQGTQGDTPMSIVSKNWYVKGRGMVKVEFTATPKGGQPKAMVLQEPD